MDTITVSFASLGLSADATAADIATALAPYVERALKREHKPSLEDLAKRLDVLEAHFLVVQRWIGITIR